jgi:LacI family transcriptional regulator
MDDLSQFCCLNTNCPDHGRRGAENLTVTFRYGPNKSRRMLRCRTCRDRFSERKGTALFDCRLPAEKAVSVLEHIAEVAASARPGGFAR